MSTRIRPLSYMTLLVALIALPLAAAAQDKDTASDTDAFVDMPAEYYEAQREETRKAQLAKGDVNENPGYVPGYRDVPGLGLSPHAPQFAVASPGILVPPFGKVAPGKELRFEFHGYLQPAVRFGFGQPDGVEVSTDGTSVHSDPLVPGGAFGWFDHTNTVPTPWAQLNFTYGNEIVRGTVVLGAWSAATADEAAGNYLGHAQMLFTEAYLSYTPDVGVLDLKLNVGAFPDRYGFMSKWSQGPYGASLIADIYGLGATGTLVIPFVGDFEFITEVGFKGDLSKAPIGIPSDGSNNYANSAEGSTFAAHGHFGVHFAKFFTPTLHVVYSFAQDDRSDVADDPATEENETQTVNKDGSLAILGGDLRIDAQRHGFFYLGGSHVIARNANSVSDLVQVLNTGSGAYFNERYFGFSSEGNGALTLIGTHYTLSLGTLLRHPMEFWGVGPDLSVSLFGIYGLSQTDAAEIGTIHMVKYGTELFYSFSKYMAAAFRFDHVLPDVAHSGESFVALTPKLIFRSGWNSRETITLQYSGYLMGSDVVVRGDNRLVTSSDNPDAHMLAVYGTIWW